MKTRLNLLADCIYIVPHLGKAMAGQCSMEPWLCMGKYTLLLYIHVVDATQTR